MANLEKFKEQARKFEQKEQWAKAIEQYVKAVEAFEASPEADDADLGLYNKVGDLYQKVGDTLAAIQYYERAVDKNGEAGLVNQGIALCNKILRLSPGRAQVYLKLGMLFSRKGFQAEAKQNLLEYADRMQKAGELEQAFAALKKFAEMTPGQSDIWAVLAQQARAAAKTPEQKEQVDRLLGEFEAKDKSEKRKSRLSRNMLTGEELPPEPKAKSDLVFLDLDETPAPRKSAPAMTPPAEPPAPVEVEPLAIEPTSYEAEEPAEPEETEAPAELPLLDLDSTTEPEAAAEPPLADLGFEPTTLGLEPTSFGEPAAAEAPEEEVAEAEPDAAAPLEDLEVAPAATPAPDDDGLLDLEIPEEPAEAAAPTAGLPLMDFGAPEEAPAEPVAEEPSAELEFLDIEEAAAPEAPRLAELEARVQADAQDWEGRRLLGEALLEQGERERGLAELDASADGFDQAGDLAASAAVVEELLRLDPNSIRYQQKRVELAYRQGDKSRLVNAYVELADALLRSDEPDKAIAVYQRVMEHDPANVRARSALDTLAPPAETAPAAAPPPPAPAAAAPPARGDYVDLGAMLLDDDEFSVPKDTRMRIGDEEPSGDEQKDFQQMLSAFKKGIEANVGEEDFQSHYDLGVAYKEMGLLDEAIAEFQKALRAPEGKLKGSEALGMCFFEKGQFAVAETIMRRGLDIPAHDDAERIGLLYWLGRTYEEEHKRPEALQAYNRVFAVDINFSDIGERVRSLAKAGV